MTYTEQRPSEKPQKRRRKARIPSVTECEERTEYGLQEHFMTDIMEAYTEWKGEREFAFREY